MSEYEGEDKDEIIASNKRQLTLDPKIENIANEFGVFFGGVEIDGVKIYANVPRF